LVQTEGAIGRLRGALLWGGPPLVLLSALAGWLLAGRALRPVERLRRQVARATRGQEIPELEGS
jgi:hypothetical protein